MKEFEPYVQRLGRLVARTLKDPASVSKAEVAAALDGQASAELRQAVPTKALRDSGAFFTGSVLAAWALDPVRDLDRQSVVLDPACGAGDLLIACAMRMPKGKTIEGTVAAWNDRIRGRDLHAQFISAARTRLVLAAAIRSGMRAPRSRALQHALPCIQQGDGTHDEEVYRGATHIVVNPPFGGVVAPESCVWGQGKVSDAALFLDRLLDLADDGARLVAILPDVLRSGTRYQKWRRLIAERLDIHRIDSYGRFARWADVDVFVVDGKVRANQRRPTWKMPSRHKGLTVGDLFTVSVGPLVEFRHEKKGRWYPYLKSAAVPRWTAFVPGKPFRRFAGPVHKPPFAVVRRTSRPEDQWRAVGSIVQGAREVAVDNHLMVIRPKRVSLKLCRELLKVLQRADTNTWLNQRIRCRHLTVAALMDIPWSTEGKHD